MADQSDPTPLQALWKTLTLIDKAKINRWMALRNALAVAIPLSIGIALRNPLAGVAIATGALNVSYSDGRDPYTQRARRMLTWSIVGAIAVFIGSVTGRNSWLAVLVALIWAFIAGMLVSVSTRMGDLGLNTLVSLIVYSARAAMPFEGAAAAGALVLLGGVIQTGMALLFWPLRASGPERRAVAQAYRKLSKELDPTLADPLTTALTPLNQQTQEVLDALGQDHSIEGERYRLLFDQADRIRLSVFVLTRLRDELARGNGQNQVLASVETLLVDTSKLIDGLADCLESDACSAQQPGLLRQVSDLLETVPQGNEQQSGLLKELADEIEVLAGQLRLVVRLASHSGLDGASQFAREESTHSLRLRITSWILTMRANLTPRSAFLRHAIRLCTCVALGDAVGRMISWQRSYWIPMTIAVVLKPDFTTTISRGVLRLAGTFLGLLVATGLYHLFPQSAVTELFLVGIFTLLLRSLGPANYGIFSVAISGLIVFLIAETGIPPSTVVSERAINTAAGGIFALVAYALWPTWERTQVSSTVADMLDAARAYFRSVAERFGLSEALKPSELDQYRADWRRTRSAAEASVDRVSSEPRTPPEQSRCLTSMLASSSAFVYSVMGLEAEILKEHSHTAPEAFRTFAHDVELTLYFLAAALRGSSGGLNVLPKLREDYTRMVQARDQLSLEDELVLIETDRLTSALNTLREQVTRYVGG